MLSKGTLLFMTLSSVSQLFFLNCLEKHSFTLLFILRTCNSSLYSLNFLPVHKLPKYRPEVPEIGRLKQGDRACMGRLDMDRPCLTPPPPAKSKGEKKITESFLYWHSFSTDLMFCYIEPRRCNSSELPACLHDNWGIS